MVEPFVHMVGFNLLLVPKRREKIKGGLKLITILENLNQLKRCIFACHIHCKLCKFKMLSMQLKLCKKNVDWCKDQGALANELLYTVKAYYFGCGVGLLLCDF